ncbi:hypothetical protein PoB_001297200 [Plakobranchus ocellatus]|uniref:Uncharacterized protein n=1 Tax=Plakobranchus ocellatus TaxID=259542 RepID=A0AAV3YWB9_9GAST|nr:hypothetical protein PoB_001297200 [Plakobranchus ocellatus]
MTASVSHLVQSNVGGHAEERILESLARLSTSSIKRNKWISGINLKRFQAEIKASTNTVNELLLAGDCSQFYPRPETAMQCNVDKCSEACNKFDWTMRSKKSELMYQPAKALHCAEHHLLKRLNMEYNHHSR